MKLTILYIEDESTIRDKMSKIFKYFFTKVYTAKDGEEAFKIYKENIKNIDLVITDINLPKVNGIDLIKKIKYLNNKQKTYIFSVKNQLNLHDEVYSLGVEHYFSKPNEMKLLLDTIDFNFYPSLQKQIKE